MVELEHTFSSFMHILGYISVRATGAFLTAFILTVLFGYIFIQKYAQIVLSTARMYTPETHKAKGYTPTMGGICMLMSILCSIGLWCSWADSGVWIFAAALTGFGIIGGLDDWSKIKRTGGMSARTKFSLQIALAACIALMLIYWYHVPTTVMIPFFKQVTPNIGKIGFIVWSIFILVGTSNAVNLTDGLDGLAVSVLLPNFITMAIAAYLAGHVLLAHYLYIPFTGSAQLAIAGAAAAGACLGFIWHNAYPARMWMGDVGSLSLGAALAVCALIAKQELLLAMTGFIFVLETLSVIIQVVWVRYFKRRFFKMAPLHHHFELLGWPEPVITVRFSIITLLLCLVALITLKIR